MSRSRWQAQNAEKWLTFLARHLENNIHGPDLAWWQLSRATPRWATALAAGLVMGIATILAIEAAFPVVGMVYFGFTRGLATGLKLGLTGLTIGLRFEPLMGLAAGLAGATVALVTHEDTQYPRVITPRRGLQISTIAGLVFGLMVGTALWGALPSTTVLVTAAFAGIVAAVATAIAQGRGANLRFRRGAFAGAVVGIVTGLTLVVIVGYFDGRFYGIHGGITFGIIAALLTGVVVLITSAGDQRPSRGWHWNIRRGILIGVLAVIVAGLAYRYFILPGEQWPYAVTFGLAFGVAGAIVAGMEGVPDNLSAAVNPGLVLARDRSTTLVLALLTGVAGGLVAGLLTGLLYGYVNVAFNNTFYEVRRGLAIGLAIGLASGIGVGLAAALVFGFTVSGFGSAWPQWITARGWLALGRQLPLRLTEFLSDAHRRGVLRQAGAVYQFRHIELQHRLGRPYERRLGLGVSLPGATISSSGHLTRTNPATIVCGAFDTSQQSKSDPRYEPHILSSRWRFAAITKVVVLTPRLARWGLVAVVAAVASAAAMGGSLVLAGVVSLTESPMPHPNVRLAPHPVLSPTPTRVAATKHLILQPWTPSGLSPGVRVVAAANGVCPWESALPSGRSDVYACLADHQLFDPCFASPSDFDAFFVKEGAVVCLDPGPDYVVLIHVTATLRDPDASSPRRHNIWLLTLANGDVCYLFPAETLATYQGKQLSGQCSDGGVTQGKLQRTGRVWKIYYQESANSAKVLMSIAVAYT